MASAQERAGDCASSKTAASDSVPRPYLRDNCRRLSGNEAEIWPDAADARVPDGGRHGQTACGSAERAGAGGRALWTRPSLPPCLTSPPCLEVTAGVGSCQAKNVFCVTVSEVTDPTYAGHCPRLALAPNLPWILAATTASGKSASHDMRSNMQIDARGLSFCRQRGKIERWGVLLHPTSLGCHVSLKDGGETGGVQGDLPVPPFRLDACCLGLVRVFTPVRPSHQDLADVLVAGRRIRR